MVTFDLFRLDGLWWLLILLGPFLFLQRRLHQETQAILLLITRRREISLALFSLVFFPGVFLHEISHYVSARLLGVRTGRFSLIPRPLEDGRLQLGYVETAQVDFLRDAIIGLAPLIWGSIFVAYAGLWHFDLPSLWVRLKAESGGAFLLAALSYFYEQPDFWVWFYLIFVVSSSMMPSKSDQRAWLPLLLFIGLILGMSLLAGFGPWLAQNLAWSVNSILRAMSMVFGISLTTHLVLLIPLIILRMLLERLTGLKVV